MRQQVSNSDAGSLTQPLSLKKLRQPIGHWLVQLELPALPKQHGHGRRRSYLGNTGQVIKRAGQNAGRIGCVGLPSDRCGKDQSVHVQNAKGTTWKYTFSDGRL